jgi:arabinofuranan 3-O-arabinosyltransferase
MRRVASVRAGSRVGLLQHALLAVLAFAPTLAAARGRVAADTRQDLYVDPGDFLTRALTLWDPHVHLGTVTHSNIGNTFPIGTFYAVTDGLGVPAWVAQRLWLGGILFAAGAGVLFLARSIRWRSGGILVAAAAYLLSPYVLQYAPRTSILLLPFAALPWLIGLTERALRTGGWRHPALMALLAMASSGANVSTFALVALGPALWIAFALGGRATTWRRVGVVVGRTAILTAGTCALWLTALVVEARHGLNLLAYTETLPQVSTTSTAFETLRGLGYWLFYGTEAREPNISAAPHYLETTAVLVVSFAVPGLALVSALLLRWRHRAFCVALILTGVIVGVGAYPFDDPSLVGRGFKSLADISSAGLALRSSTRAVPLAVLGMSLLLGAGVGALWTRSTRAGVVATGVVAALVLIDAIGLLSGDVVDPNFSRGTVPAYWRAAATALDRSRHDTRVLEIPGSQFAAYRWGSTYDTPILPTLISRPSVAREEIPFGSPAAADLLSALDRRIQEGVFEPQALAPVARLLSAGAVLLRSDLAFERYATPRPQALWGLLQSPPPGLGPPVGYGAPRPNRPDPHVPLLDAQTLGIPASAPEPPPVAVYRVTGVPSIVHAVASGRPTLLDGDGEGLVDAASAGLVTGANPILYSPSLSTRPRDLRRALGAGADLVVTDTNRRRERRWRSTSYTTGLTDRAGHSQPPTGQGEAELNVFPGTTDASRTVTEARGATVEASAYGGLVTFNPEQRAASAFDGDPSTAWEVGTIVDPRGTHLTLRSDRPLVADHLDLVQAQGGFRTRFVSEVLLRFDGGAPVRVRLDPRSWTPPGQTVTFPQRRFSTLDIEVTDTVTTPEASLRGVSGTGFAEVGVPGLRVDELIRLPEDLTRRLSPAEASPHRLTYVLTRLRANPAVTDHGDEERSLARVFTTPDSRVFSLSGTARLSAALPDDVVDRLLGSPDAGGGGVTITSSGRLPGAIDQRASAALDGDPATHWTGSLVQQAGAWVQVGLPTPHTIDQLDLSVVADGRHSVPTQVRVDAEGGSRVVELPTVTDGSAPDAVRATPVRFAPLTGSTFRVTVTAVRELDSPDATSGLPQPLPVAVAELGLPGVVAPPAPAALPGDCRRDVVTIDGAPVGIRVVGSTTDAVARRGLRVEACDGPVLLGRGRHVLRTAPGSRLGVDVDRLVLGSDRGGGPLPLDDRGDPVPPPPPEAAPTVKVVKSGSTSMHLRVSASSRPSWLVLGESRSDGWTARLSSGHGLGAPTLVNGYANGWYLPAGGAREVVLTWTPQRTIRAALIVAALGLLLCLVLVGFGRRWRADPDDHTATADDATLGWPGGRTLRDPRLVVGVAALAGLATGIVVDVWGGIAVAVVVAVAASWRYGRALLAAVALALVASGFLGVVWHQHDDHRRVGYDWTAGEETQHRLTLTGLMLVGVDPILGAITRGRRPRRVPHPEGGE